jgi:hypothetical protein
MTNILALPQAQLGITTGTNEDWLDSVEYVYDDGSGNPDTQWPQLDLRGIKFWLQVRPNAVAAEVDIEGTTDDGTLLIGAYPEVGFLIFNVGEPIMRNLVPGSSYVADVVATADGYTRVTLQIDLTIVQGITREPFLKSPWTQSPLQGATETNVAVLRRAPMRIAASAGQRRLARAMVR